jgi:hypothetical protein
MKNFILLFIILLVFGCNERNSGSESERFEREIANAKLTEFKELYFVATYSGIPSIFRYQVEKGKTKVFWSHKDEKVMQLLVSDDRQTAYFLTKHQQRLKSSKPAIERGHLYRIDMNIGKVESITQLDEGIQMIPFWTDDDRFTLVINSIDKTIASYINKNTQVYNKFGKLLSDNNETFDITKDGYPITKLPALKYSSSSGRFKLEQKGDTVLIHQSGSKNAIKSIFEKKELKQIGWAENNKQVVILFMENGESESLAQNKPSSLLIIFDLQKKKIVKSFDGQGYKRFVLIGDLLIFDDGFGRDSFIELFSLSSLSENKRIKISGGCSLKNISDK